MNFDLNPSVSEKKQMRTKLKPFGLALLVSLFSFSAAADLSISLILCKQNKMVRTLRVETDEDQKCRAIYTKQGIDENIGSGSTASGCDGFVEGVRKTLEEAQWNCRNVKEARTSAVFLGSE